MASSGRGTTKNPEVTSAPRSAGGRTAPRQRGPSTSSSEHVDPPTAAKTAKTAAPKVKAAADKVAPDKVAPAKVVPAKTSTRATPAKAAATKVASTKSASKSTSSKPASRTAPSRATASRTTASKTTASKTTASKTTARTATAGRTTTSTSTTKPGAKSAGTRPTGSASRRTSGSASGPAAPDLVVREDEAPWTPAELQEVRSGLESDVARLSTEIDVATTELQQLLRDSGEGTGDDQADAGAKTFEREQEISLANNSRGMLEQSLRALARLDDGSYGACESCGRPVGKMRLLAFPRATLCVSCKQQQERR